MEWNYDGLNRLTGEVLDSSNDALDFTAIYTFDLTGNRLSKTVDHGDDTVLDEVVSYTYDDGTL